MTKVVNWYRFYSEGWGDDIVPDAYSHPAKYARGLIRQIYRYALERGFVQAGDHVVDPFGGVALGSLDAMLSGLHWTGCELEEKFVALGNANLDLWRGRYAPHFPAWGSARLVQGDSRQLRRVIGDAAAVVSSPPYAGSEMRGGPVDPAAWADGRVRGVGASHHAIGYGSADGQLGSMREGNYSAAIASPPFGEAQSGGGIASALNGDGDYQLSQQGGRFQGYQNGHQAHTTGNLATLKADDTGYAAAVSSPPYSESLQNHGASRAKNLQGSQNGLGDYPATEGNLGHMSACVSSPPYENAIHDAGNGADRLKKKHEAGLVSSETYRKMTRSGEVAPGIVVDGYGFDNAQLGNDRGETFWSAAALIVAQVYQVLKPGGYTFWVCKDFVRNKKRVPFSDQWQALCEAHGFVPVERVRAWVVEDHGTQGNMFGDDKPLRKERKSFFRRLAEKNGSPRIDWEDVIIMRKPIG